MEKDVGTILVEFNNLAANIYSATFDQFSESIRKIKRNKDENVFKLQSAKYEDMLKHRLEVEVKKILQANDHQEFHKQLEFALLLRINYYLQEFRQRSNAL